MVYVKRFTGNRGAFFRVRIVVTEVFVLPSCGQNRVMLAAPRSTVPREGSNMKVWRKKTVRYLKNGNGVSIRRDTVAKEVMTFQLIWNWAVTEEMHRHHQ